MKDLVCCLLDINLSVQNNAVEKRLFNRVVKNIDYYWLIQPPMPTKSSFLWLAQLTLLVSLLIDPNRIKSKSFSDNCSKSNRNMSDWVSSKKLVTKKELMTEEKLETEEKFKMEKEIETKDLVDPE